MSTIAARRTRLTAAVAVTAALGLSSVGATAAPAAERARSNDAKAAKVLSRVTSAKASKQARSKPKVRPAKRGKARTTSARAGRFYNKYDLGCVSFPSEGLYVCGTNQYFDVAVHIWDNGTFSVGWIGFDAWNYLVHLHYAQ
jgi:hypothetical protein